MIRIVRTFGAPVIEPPGKAARTQSVACRPSRSWDRMVLTIWWTVLKVSMSKSRSTVTEPGTAGAGGAWRDRATAVKVLGAAVLLAGGCARWGGFFLWGAA